MKFNILNKELIKKKALKWAENFSHFAWLDGNNIPYLHEGFPSVLAAGKKQIITPAETCFSTLKDFLEKQPPKWLFGFFTYDLKNELEKLSSSNTEFISFPKLCFFEPKHLIFFEEDHLFVHSEDPELIFNEIQNTDAEFSSGIQNLTAVPASKISQDQYIEKIKKIKEHLHEGDIYELNYCIEFTAEGNISPVYTYLQLNELSPMPFSCLYKTDDRYLISASPERFLKKEDNKLISQPIKGTRKRGATMEEDIRLIEELKTSEKEISENMMIVDLVRNDLSRSCKPGTVEAEDLFGVHTFRQVHQMISTITGILKENTDSVEAIKHAFPMGSMTGAPKIRSMELIEVLEESKRGLFSGAAGYFTPDGNFDFNVIIRSIFYDHTRRRISFQVGSAITFDADAEKEYEECMVKASSMLSVLS